MRRVASLTCAAVLVAALAGCQRGPNEPPRHPLIRVGVLPFLGYAPHFIAADRGVFAAHGLDVSLVPVAPSEVTLVLARGEVDVTSQYLSVGLFNLIAQGASVTIVADKGHAEPGGCGDDGFVARRDLVGGGQLDTAKGLKGRWIVYDQASVEEFLLERLLVAEGMTLADVKKAGVPESAKADALRGGYIDLVHWSEPQISQMQDAAIGTLWRSTAQIAPGLQFAFVVYGKRLAESEPEVGERFMAAYLEAVLLYHDGPVPANVAAIAAHTGLPEETVRRSCWPNIRADGEIDVESVKAFQRWAVDHGYLEAVVPAERFWQPRFIVAARAEAQRGGGR